MMKITHTIKMNLARQGVTPQISVVQGDTDSREIVLSLFADRGPWKIPQDAAIVIRYLLPDRSCGAYDTLADGTPAIRVNGNAVCIRIAPEVMTMPGEVSLTVTLMRGQQRLSTFAIRICVEPDSVSSLEDTAGRGWIAAFMPAGQQAQVGQYLKVSATTDNGTVTQVEGVDLEQRLETISQKLQNVPGILQGHTTQIAPSQVASAIHNGAVPAIWHWDSRYGDLLLTNFTYVDYIGSLVASVAFFRSGQQLLATLTGDLHLDSWHFQLTQPEAPDWDAAEGQAGHIRNRTHWAIPGDTILPNTTLVSSGATSASVPGTLSALTIGQDYVFLYNGEEYTCPVVDSNPYGLVDIKFCGNFLRSMGMGDTGEPFFLMIPPSGAAQVFDVSGGTPATLAIRQADQVHKLAEKYLPAGYSKEELLAYILDALRKQ